MHRPLATAAHDGHFATLELSGMRNLHLWVSQRGLMMDKGEIVEATDITKVSLDRELQRKFMAL